MGYSINIPNGRLSFSKLDFECPSCSRLYCYEEYCEPLYKSEYMLIYMRCKTCKSELGITLDMTGDVAVWLKSDEEKDKLTM